MLLQQIVQQLDGELERLRSLRKVVAGLGKSPAVVRTLIPRLEEVMHSKAEAALLVPASEHTEEPKDPASSEPSVAPPEAMAELPNRTPAGARLTGRIAGQKRERQARSRRPMEPGALSKGASTGPVVISAAALAREREGRLAAKAAASEHPVETAQEVRPDAFARELAARWLSSPGKA